MRNESLAFLKELLTTPSPSGYESKVQKIWCDYARGFADEVMTDSYGNAVAVLNPGARPRIMLDGHADEIGLMIKHIDGNGFVYVQQIGGVDTATIRGKRVSIHAEKGCVRGVLGVMAIHLQERGVEAKAPKMHECYIDIGAKNKKDAQKRVAVGDPITFVDDFEMINGRTAVARGFDNRAGIWTAIEALRIAAAGKPKCAIYACSSVQEEIGLAGAAMTVANVKPDAAVAVDVTHATDTPGINVMQHGEVKLGGGPTVSIGRENHPLVVERLRKTAKSKKIPLQIETFGGGTDALAIWTKNGGVPSALVSIPNRYMHSTVEMVDLRDLEQASQLLGAFCLSIKKDETFKVRV
ncbi:MAG: M42 family metallopeptidase [Elusimicrobiota bacterium]